jgi:hypothetical protein
MRPAGFAEWRGRRFPFHLTLGAASRIGGWGFSHHAKNAHADQPSGQDYKGDFHE